MRGDDRHVEFILYTSSITLARKRTHRLGSHRVLPLRALNCPPCTSQNRKSRLYPEQGKSRFLRLEHVLRQAGLRKVNARGRKEQLARLTLQGSVYILSPPTTV